MAPNMLELRVPPVAVAAGVAFGMFIVSRVPGACFLMPGKLPMAVLLGVAGLGIAMAGVVAFRAHRTTVDPLRPDGATRIVSSGIYRLSRNPMYLGFALMLAAWGMQLGSAAALIGVPFFVLYMNRFQILPEERLLTEKFGVQYQAYMGKVRRWI